MKKQTLTLILLVVVVITGIVTGARFIYASQWHYPLQMILGIICFLGSATAVVSYRLYHKENTGKYYTLLTIISVFFNSIVAFYAIIIVLEILGYDFFPPQQ